MTFTRQSITSEYNANTGMKISVNYVSKCDRLRKTERISSVFIVKTDRNHTELVRKSTIHVSYLDWLEYLK